MQDGTEGRCGESLVCSTEQIKTIVRNVNCEAKVFQTFQGVGKRFLAPSIKGGHSIGVQGIRKNKH